MKADLGALVLGMLMSDHKRAPEVAESLDSASRKCSWSASF